MDLAGQCTSGLAPAELGWSRHGSPWLGSAGLVMARHDKAPQVSARRGRTWLVRPSLLSARRAASWLGAPRRGLAVAGRGEARLGFPSLHAARFGESGPVVACLGFPGRGEASLIRGSARPVMSRPGSAWPVMARPGEASLADIRQSESLAAQSQQIADRYEAVRLMRRSVGITFVSDHVRAA